MIIQNTTANQAAPPATRVSNDAHKAVANTPNTQPALGVAVDTKQIAAQQPSPEQLKNAVEIINQVMRQSSNSLEFSVDDDTNKSIVKLVDTETGELIRQYPSEETLAISRSIDRFQQGLLLKQKA